MIRIRLYGIDGREHGCYELDDKALVIQPKPLFTLERIVVEPEAEFLLTSGQEETIRRAAEAAEAAESGL